LDPAQYPDPLKVDLDRPEESYVNFGWGPHSCIGKEINILANTAILRTFARLPGLRRAPGPQGQLKHVMQQEVVKVYLQEDWGSYWFFPTSNPRTLFGANIQLGKSILMPNKFPETGLFRESIVAREIVLLIEYYIFL
jgi:hypothetical protein